MSNEKMYMNIHTGSVDTRDGWNYQNDDLVYVNAVDLGEVVEVVTLDGKNYNTFDAFVQLMDDDIREKLHSQLAPCGDQEFLDAYAEAHRLKFDEEFEIQ